jgi:type VI secretion system secreted protein VgrG
MTTEQPFGNEERFFFAAEKHPDTFQVVSFSGGEGLSRLYEFRIELVSKKDDVRFDDLVGKPAVLTIRGWERERYVHGIVLRFEVLRVFARHTIYQVLLVPPEAKLDLRRSMRIFQKKTTREIVEQVLKDGGVTRLAWKLKESYQPRDYCVQYRETDLDFIHRLLEEEGIAYHFEHTKSELQTVFTDNAAAFEAIEGKSTLIYKEDASMVRDQEVVSNLVYSQQLCAGAVVLRDYNFKKPTMRVKGTAAGKEPKLELYDYPGEFVEPALGKRLAQTRLQELETEHRVGDGNSDCNRLLPGCTFTLGGKNRRHPREDLNQTYLLLVVHHSGSQEQVLEEEGSGGGASYENGFVVIPDKVEYRPPRVTQRPEVFGTHTATVVGPAGEEIYTDTYGRVKVRFHWDRESSNDEKSSCWIRVAQSSAGAGFGAVFIPRVGHEVLVSFLEGDPDRPVITGRVYNGKQTVPYELPADKTRSTFKTCSSPGGKGFNELRFEDKAGQEEIFIHAQRDLNELVENDQSTTIKHDRKERVDFDEKMWIYNKRYLSVAKDSTHTANTITLQADQQLTLKVGSSSIVFTPSSFALKADTIQTTADGTVTIKGALVKINS